MKISEIILREIKSVFKNGFIYVKNIVNIPSAKSNLLHLCRRLSISNYFTKRGKYTDIRVHLLVN